MNFCFAEAVQKIDPKQSLTKSEDYICVGKTMSRRLEDGSIKSSCVLLAGIINEVLGVCIENKDFREWNLMEKQALYVIYHEFGHCMDAKYRFQESKREVRGEDKLFRIKNVFRYYSAILADELAACVFSANIMTGEVFELELQNTKAVILNNLKGLEAQKEEYRTDNSKLYELAFSVSGLFWLVLIQYAKLIGNKIGNKKLEKSTIDVWDGASDKTAQILTVFGNNLSKYWRDYPNWNRDFHNSLFDAWNSLALEHGYYFIESPAADSLFWNN
jgi:hypothetical protein